MVENTPAPKLMSTDLAELVQAFYTFLETEKRYSPNTLVAYKRDLEDLFGFLKNHQSQVPSKSTVEDLVPETLTSYLASLHGERKKTTLNRRLSSIRSFFTFLLNRYKIENTKILSFKEQTTRQF